MAFSLTDPVCVEQQRNVMAPRPPFQELPSVRTAAARSWRACDSDDFPNRLTPQGSETRNVGCQTSSWRPNDNPVDTQTRGQSNDEVEEVCYIRTVQCKLPHYGRGIVSTTCQMSIVTVDGSFK